MRQYLGLFEQHAYGSHTNIPTKAPGVRGGALSAAPIVYNHNMRRRLFAIATVLSLLMCLATVVLWVRSYAVSYDLTACASNKCIEFRVSPGIFAVLTYPDILMPREISVSSSPAHPDITRGRYGFYSDYVWQDGWIVGAPFWAIALFWTMVPGMWALYRMRRKPPGLCPTCSYNLMGNTSGVCPECGMTIRGPVMSGLKERASF